jgi:uncharacterized membrane protein YdfJ with MMPL/SSD domain
MAALLIPSVSALLGHLIWWPGHSAERAGTSPLPAALQPKPLPEESG